MSGVTTEQARGWLMGQCEMHDDIESNYLVSFIEGSAREEIDAHVEFVAECMNAGVKPTHFVTVMRDLVKRYMDDTADMQYEIDMLKLQVSRNKGRRKR